MLDWGVRRVISYKSLIQEQMDGESLKSDSLVTNQHWRIVLVAELKPIKKNFGVKSDQEIISGLLAGMSSKFQAGYEGRQK